MRLPFLSAVALVAAALCDPFVETVSNTGVFGHGYSDHNHVSVIPALVAGVVLIFIAIGARCLDVCRHSGERRDWIVGVARHISARSPVRDVPYVFVLQIAALYVMESTEQLLLGGRLAGGAAWLGGPVWFSLLAHGVAASFCTLAITRAARALLKRLAALVAQALDFILLAFARLNSGIVTDCRNAFAFHSMPPLDVRQIGERAPPFLLTLT
jgi:hypothetical protein